MDDDRARDLFYKYRAAVAYVAVESRNGDQAIGTAFHLGDDIWVTARHVVEGNRILKVATTGYSVEQYSQLVRASRGIDSRLMSYAGDYEVVDKPMFHPDDGVDVALLRLRAPDAKGQAPPPTVQLGDWLDDWLGDELTLSTVLVMGYPPIPFGKEPLLVSARAEVNTVLDKRKERHPHFILSTMARGGFSGSLALTDFECALGVGTESLVMDAKPVELGYFAVLSVEPIFVCLDEHGVTPDAQQFPGD